LDLLVRIATINWRKELTVGLGDGSDTPVFDPWNRQPSFPKDMMSKNLAVLHSLGDSGILLDFGIGRNPQEPYQPVIKGDGEEEVEGGASGSCNGFDGLGDLDGRSVAWTMSLGHLDYGLDVDVAYRGVLLRVSHSASRGGSSGSARRGRGVKYEEESVEQIGKR
jgi:hypothetical protein